MENSRDELLKKNYDLGEDTPHGILKKSKEWMKSPQKFDRKENYKQKMDDSQKMFDISSPKLDIKF